jgi:hypothetical protein
MLSFEDAQHARRLRSLGRGRQAIGFGCRGSDDVPVLSGADRYVGSGVEDLRIRQCVWSLVDPSAKFETVIEPGRQCVRIEQE